MATTMLGAEQVHRRWFAFVPKCPRCASKVPAFLGRLLICPNIEKARHGSGTLGNNASLAASGDDDGSLKRHLCEL